MRVAEQARHVIANVDPEWLHAALAEAAACPDKATAFLTMRTALREGGMEGAVADRVVEQFALLVHAQRGTLQ